MLIVRLSTKGALGTPGSGLWYPGFEVAVSSPERASRMDFLSYSIKSMPTSPDLPPQ